MKWHFGCGNRRFPGWRNTDRDVDLLRPLPFNDRSLLVVLGQHVIEHINLDEGLALCGEIYRCLAAGGSCYLSTPDLSKICQAYAEGNLEALLADRVSRFPNFRIERGAPISHLVNHVFHQRGEHKLLYDFPLLEWVLKHSGFGRVDRIDEATLLAEQPDVARRGDDLQSLYVRARK
jgi:predicted SAM-dependent methyltransferase